MADLTEQLMPELDGAELLCISLALWPDEVEDHLDDDDMALIADTYVHCPEDLASPEFRYLTSHFVHCQECLEAVDELIAAISAQQAAAPEADPFVPDLSFLSAGPPYVAEEPAGGIPPTVEDQVREQMLRGLDAAQRIVWWLQNLLEECDDVLDRRKAAIFHGRLIKSQQQREKIEQQLEAWQETLERTEARLNALLGDKEGTTVLFESSNQSRWIVLAYSIANECAAVGAPVIKSLLELRLKWATRQVQNLDARLRKRRGKVLSLRRALDEIAARRPQVVERLRRTVGR